MSGAGQEHPRQGYSAAERVSVSRFLSFAEIVRACRQLDRHDVLAALRQRRLPMPMQAKARDLLAALQHVFGQLLIKRAQERLFELHPSFSAKSGLSRW